MPSHSPRAVLEFDQPGNKHAHSSWHPHNSLTLNSHAQHSHHTPHSRHIARGINRNMKGTDRNERDTTNKSKRKQNKKEQEKTYKRKHTRHMHARIQSTQVLKEFTGVEAGIFQHHDVRVVNFIVLKQHAAGCGVVPLVVCPSEISSPPPPPTPHSPCSSS